MDGHPDEASHTVPGHGVGGEADGRVGVRPVLYGDGEVPVRIGIELSAGAHTDAVDCDYLGSKPEIDLTEYNARGKLGAVVCVVRLFGRQQGRSTDSQIRCG